MVQDAERQDDVERRRLANYGRLDGLVHNAGALPAERAESPDGHELTIRATA